MGRVSIDSPPDLLVAVDSISILPITYSPHLARDIHTHIRFFIETKPRFFCLLLLTRDSMTISFSSPVKYG